MSNIRCCWLGLDPGGVDAFGIAAIWDDNSFETAVVDSLDDAFAKLEKWTDKTSTRAVGIDAPLWWSSGRGGAREVDTRLRQKYGLASGTVQSPNSLRGAAAIQGPLAARLFRSRYPKIQITETHPKALRKAFQQNRLTERACQKVETFYELARLEAMSLKTEHENDALLGAFVAREGATDRWRFDLATQVSRGGSEHSLWVEDVHYWWPEEI